MTEILLQKWIPSMETIPLAIFVIVHFSFVSCVCILGDLSSSIFFLCLCGDIGEVEEESKEECFVPPPAGLVASSVAMTGGGNIFTKLKSSGLL